MNKKKVTYVLSLVVIYSVLTMAYTVVLGIEFSLLGFVCSLIFGVACQYSKLWFASAIIGLLVTLLYIYPKTNQQAKKAIIDYLNEE